MRRVKNVLPMQYIVLLPVALFSLVAAIWFSQNPAQAQANGNVVEVIGVSSNDVLNVRSGPGTQYQMVGALANGDRVRRLRCQQVSSSRWCQIEMMTDMRGRGWVNARYLSRSATAQKPNRPSKDVWQRVRFAAGASGVNISGALAPGQSRRYILAAQNGQDLHFRLAVKNPLMSYQIFNPDGTFLLELMRAQQEYRGQLWQSGDHVIEVINRSNRAQKYNAIFGIN